MRMRTIGTALAVVLLAAGGAYAQQAPEPQDQMRAPGAGTANPPGQDTKVSPTGGAKNNVPTTSQGAVNADQQKAPGTGTATAPGQKTQTTGKGPGPARATPPAPGTANDDRGSAPGTGTAQPAKK